jgi:hypothetical protein
MFKGSGFQRYWFWLSFGFGFCFLIGLFRIWIGFGFFRIRIVWFLQDSDFVFRFSALGFTRSAFRVFSGFGLVGSFRIRIQVLGV